MSNIEEDNEELSLGDDDAFETDDEGGEMAEEMMHDEADGSADEDENDDAADRTPSGPDTSVARFSGHSDSVVCLAVSPDGLLACSGSVDDTACIWRVGDGVLVSSLAHVETVAAVAFSASGKLLATGSFDGVVRVWTIPAAGDAPAPDSSSQTPLAPLDGPGGDILFLAWHPLGDVLLAGSSDSTVWMWSVGKSTACMQVFAAGEGDAAAGAFTLDGKKVLVGSHDGSLRIFSPKTGACEHAFTGRSWDAPITALVQSSLDQSLVAVTTMDGLVRIVNILAKKVVLSADHNDEATAGSALPGDAAMEDESRASAEW